MNKKIFLLAFLSIFAAQLAAQIVETTNPKGWLIETKSSAYVLKIDQQNSVLPLFFGSKSIIGANISEDRSRTNGPFSLYEVPVRGKYADKDPVVEVVFEDGTRDIELEFVSAEKIEIDGRATLKISQRDKFYPLIINSFMRVLPEYDIIEKWIEIKNVGKSGVIKVENAKSGSIGLPLNQYQLIHHSGAWFGEFQLKKTELTAGTKTLESRDFYSFENTPWFAVTDNIGDEQTAANVWFGQVHYSGNWKIDFHASYSGHLQISGGINFWDTDYYLNPNQTLVTPKMSIGFTTGGTDAVAINSSNYIRNEILPAQTAHKERPILYNSWYATGFDVNEAQQVELAKIAKKIGVELFVIDDGWFKGRKTDNAGLGDWTVDKDKFPTGLNPLIQKINDLGMDFGIWVEPEMVNPNSDLYRNHPDWVLHYKNRTKTEWRNQLTLNLARQDVYNYLLESMTNLLKNHNIKFIKWDRNRGLTQPNDPSIAINLQREIRIKYIENLYKLIAELRSRFPDVLFENCSSGGGRPDLGMLARMDQTWTSDNTDPVDRLFIQYGYLSAFPSNTMVCWTNNADEHKINPELDFVFDVAMMGVLGIGQDITKWDEKEQNIVAAKIQHYKNIRKYIQNGDVYRLRSPFNSNKVAIQYNISNDNSAVILCYNLGETIDGNATKLSDKQPLKLKGLIAEKNYLVTINGIQQKLSGKYLTEVGLNWSLKGSYKSMIIELRAE